MNIQQILIIIVMTVVISIPVAVMVDTDNIKEKAMIYGAVMFAWAFLVVTIDLYINISKLRQDMNTYMVNST